MGCDEVSAVDAGVIADEPSTSSAKEEFGHARDQHRSLTRQVVAIWNNLRSSQPLADVDMQFQTTEYRDEMTMDSLIEGEAAYFGESGNHQPSGVFTEDMGACSQNLGLLPGCPHFLYTRSIT